MTISVQPLLTLSEARIQEELWRAELITANGATYGRKTPLLPVCLVAGLDIIGFSLDPTGSDLARVLFYGVRVLGLGVPSGTRLGLTGPGEDGEGGGGVPGARVDRAE